MQVQQYVLWYEQLGMQDVERVGGKNASLGEMISNLSGAGVSVPGGRYSSRSSGGIGRLTGGSSALSTFQTTLQAEFPGVWLDPDTPKARKICAIGVKVGSGSTERRTMHGFALNVDPDMTYMRQHIVPCGVAEYPVTSLKEEGIDVSMQDVVKIVSRLAIERWGGGEAEQQ